MIIDAGRMLSKLLESMMLFQDQARNEGEELNAVQGFSISIDSYPWFHALFSQGIVKLTQSCISLPLPKTT